MNYYLFLDDMREVYDVKWVQLPQDERWIVARSYGEFVKTVLDLGLPSFVAFDHDLADFHYKISLQENDHPQLSFDYGPEKTGLDAAKWLCDYCMKHKVKFPDYVVHSLNVVGAKRIEDYIKGVI